MISDVIVGGAVAFAVVFVAAWLASPRLRTRIERPKHQFQEAVTGYDRARGQEGRPS
ncbi:MAG: hypothetical protein AB7O28_12215 [Vicinamibacterales bacterium]